MVWEISLPTTDIFTKTTVAIIAMQQPGSVRANRNAAEQLIWYLGSTECHNHDRELRTYLLIGDQCSTFRLGQGHVEYLHRGSVLEGTLDYMTDEFKLCEIAVKYWNKD